MLFGKRRDKMSKTLQKGAKSDQDVSPRSPQPANSAQLEATSANGDGASGVFSAAENTFEAVSDEPGSVLLAISRIDQLERYPGTAASGKVENGWLQLGAGDGGHALQSFPASAGDVFSAKARIVLLDGGSNSFVSRFFFGPLFLDSEGKVLWWWKPFDKPATDPVDVLVEARAPEGTVEVKLGIHGSWDSSGDAGDYVVGFANARLVKIVA